jgi:hypothetical protein
MMGWSSLRNGALVLVAVVVISVPSPTQAIQDRADIEPNDPVSVEHAIAWKLTPNFYRETAGRSAADINLRGNREEDVFWIGQYQRGTEFQQMRVGYERQYPLPFGRVIASGQYASRGFVGASATLELSNGKEAPYFGLLGFGRTNLKPYYNLNFDPNDSILLGAGWRPDNATFMTLYQVRDDRLRTEQRVTHLVLRRQTSALSRLTVDLFRRAGRSDPDSEFFHATGVTLTYDREPWFFRLALDPNANYTASNMTRLAVGIRF